MIVLGLKDLKVNEEWMMFVSWSCVSEDPWEPFFFHLFSIRSSLGSILNLDIACSTHTFHAQPASASTPFMWHENYAKLSWKLKAFSAVWSEWKRVEEWSLIVVACNKTMLRWSYTVWLYDNSWFYELGIRPSSYFTDWSCMLQQINAATFFLHIPFGAFNQSEVRQGCSN